MLSVVYSDRAITRLEQIDRYLRSRSPSGARNVREEIRRTVELLAASPGIGAPLLIGGIRIHTTRRYRYRIVYRSDSSELRILNILHARQGA